MLLKSSFDYLILLSPSIATSFCNLVTKRDRMQLMITANTITPSPVKNATPTKIPIKIIEKTKQYMIIKTIERFFGKLDSLKQSTWSKFTSSPILNFLLQRGENDMDLLTIPKVRLPAIWFPRVVSLYWAWESKKLLKNLTNIVTISRIHPLS